MNNKAYWASCTVRPSPDNGERTVGATIRNLQEELQGQTKCFTISQNGCEQRCQTKL